MIKKSQIRIKTLVVAKDRSVIVHTMSENTSSPLSKLTHKKKLEMSLQTKRTSKVKAKTLLKMAKNLTRINRLGGT